MLANRLDETFYNGRLSWRPEEKSNTIPSPSEMIKQILKFIKDHKELNEFDKSRVEDITEKFYEKHRRRSNSFPFSSTF